MSLLLPWEGYWLCSFLLVQFLVLQGTSCTCCLLSMGLYQTGQWRMFVNPPWGGLVRAALLGQSENAPQVFEKVPPRLLCVYTVTAGCKIIPLRCFHKHHPGGGCFFTFFRLWDYVNPRSCGLQSFSVGEFLGKNLFLLNILHSV